MSYQKINCLVLIRYQCKDIYTDTPRMIFKVVYKC